MRLTISVNPYLSARVGGTFSLRRKSNDHRQHQDSLVNG